MTLKEFADKYEGTTLSILYRNNIQVGFIRILDLDKQTIPLRTQQEIQIDVEHPEDGLICFNLDQIRKNGVETKLLGFYIIKHKRSYI